MNNNFILIPLQLQKFQMNANPLGVFIFVVGVAALVSIFVYINKSKKIKNSAAFQSGAVNKRRSSGGDSKQFVRAASGYGLSGNDIRFLENVFEEANIPLSGVFSAKNDSIDESFGRVYSSLARDDDAQNDIARLFEIRNAIQYAINAEEAAAGGKQVQRRYPRKDANVQASVYVVNTVVVQNGKKKEKKLQAEKNSVAGKILDISLGGCALNTQAPIKTGSYLKIEFSLNRSASAVLAQVMRINKNAANNILHMHFLKVMPKSSNNINAFIYNYKD